MIQTITTEAIIKSRNRELLKHHKVLIKGYLKNKAQLKLKTRKAILKYYDSQINESNILKVYNTKLGIFLNNLLT